MSQLSDPKGQRFVVVQKRTIPEVVEAITGVEATARAERKARARDAR